MSEALKADVFRPYIGETLSVAGGGSLTLVALEESKGETPVAPRAFSLILRGPAAPVFPEGLHRMTFADGASFEFYIMPIHTSSRDHQDYQIAFN